MKYRVICPDGNSVIIEAENTEKARTIAKSKFGKLPNEINKDIVFNIRKELILLVDSIKAFSQEISEHSREYDWNTAYSSVNSISKRLEETKNNVLKLSNSMIKVSKNNEEI